MMVLVECVKIDTPPCVCPEIGIYIRQYVVMSICSQL